MIKVLSKSDSIAIVDGINYKHSSFYNYFYLFINFKTCQLYHTSLFCFKIVSLFSV